MPGLWWAKGRSVSKYTIKFHGTGGHCFGVIYKDDVEVWRDKPWPDDGSAEQAGYEKLKKLEREDNPYILYDEQDMSRAAWLYFAIEVTLTSADIQPEDVDDALREIADDLWLEMSEDERAAADERATLTGALSESIVSFLEANRIEAEHLDGAVDQEKSKQRAEVNNGGLDEQVEYLLECGWTEEDIYLAAMEEAPKVDLVVKCLRCERATSKRTARLVDKDKVPSYWKNHWCCEDCWDERLR